MNSNEIPVNGLVQVPEQPGISTFNCEESIPSPYSKYADHDHQLCKNIYNIQALDSEPGNRLWCPHGECDPSLLLPELPEQFSFSDDYDDVFGPSSSQISTENDLASPASLYTCPLVSSTPEQGDEAEVLMPAEGAILAEPVFPSTEINTSIEVADPEDSVLPAKLSIPGTPGSVDGSARMSAGCVWHASACHEHDPRLAPSEAEMKELFKGVNKKSNRLTCEIRIAEKLRKDTKLKKDKLWLGTFDTKVQAARALQVGRFLLSDKKKPLYFAHFEQPFKDILSDFKKHLHAQLIDAELLAEVKKLANKHSNAGSNCELCFYSVNITKRSASPLSIMP